MTPTNASLGSLDPQRLAKLDAGGKLPPLTPYAIMKIGAVQRRYPLG